MTEYESLLPEALEYASYGFKVFALSPLSKIPLKNTKGFKEATTDQETIFKMFTENEQANMGISMTDNDIFVLDVDNHGGDNQGLKSLEKLLGGVPLPDDITIVETANGGYHIYMKAPAGVEIKQQINFRPSIDIIKNFVVAPSSTIKKKDGSLGTYKLENGSLNDVIEAPQAILKAITAKEQPKQSNAAYQINYSNAASGKKTWTATFLEEIVQGQEEPGRNVWLTSKIGKLLSLGMDAEGAYQFLHVINENFIYPPLPEGVVNTIFQSILNKDNKKKEVVN